MTAKWLAEQMDKDPATISKWCTNKAQPSLETIKKIVSKYFNKVQSLQSQLRLLTEARNRLLPKLMSGAIEV